MRCLSAAFENYHEFGQGRTPRGMSIRAGWEMIVARRPFRRQQGTRSQPARARFSCLAPSRCRGPDSIRQPGLSSRTPDRPAGRTPPASAPREPCREHSSIRKCGTAVRPPGYQRGRKPYRSPSWVFTTSVSPASTGAEVIALPSVFMRATNVPSSPDRKWT